MAGVLRALLTLVVVTAVVGLAAAGAAWLLARVVVGLLA